MIDYRANIQNSGLTIYDYIDPANWQLYIPTNILKAMLSSSLVGISLAGLPIKKRSKVVKGHICHALGYPIPSSFKKTKPRFPGQNFNVYTQKRRNVQIWNEDINPTTRYVFINVDENDVITCIKIITGDILAQYDRTGTLTQKYQAKMPSIPDNICSNTDTESVCDWILDGSAMLTGVNPNQMPSRQRLLYIQEIYRRLLPMVGKSVSYLDAVQERNRGAELHAMICHHLGYTSYNDNGTYPDLMNQLLEVKLQTSPTIDLGLHSPEDGLPIVTIENFTFYSEDIRYAIFNGIIQGDRVFLQNLYLVTGQDFSHYFPLFKGINRKLQILLPIDFFDF